MEAAAKRLKPTTLFPVPIGSASAISLADTISISLADASESLECAICRNDVKAKAVVVCPKCNKEACQTCVGEYLLHNLEDADGRCMYCNAAWGQSFVEASLQKKFLSGAFKDHRKGVTFAREMDYLRMSQPFAEHAILQKNATRRVEELKDALCREPKNEDFKGRLLAARRLKFDLDHQITYDPNGVPTLHPPPPALERGRDLVVPPTPRPRRQRVFLVKCPADQCRGFMDEGFMCGLCATEVCSKCRAVKGPAGHICNPDDVRSVLHIAHVSKPCPKCAAMIIRSEGCDQMWCTAPGCATAFSYSTGAVVTQGIHNPHYHEYLNRVAREGPGAGARRLPHCGGCGFSDMRLSLAVIQVSEPFALFATAANRFRFHIFDDVMRKCSPPLLPPQWVNHDLRLRYLNLDEKLSVDDFKRTLIKREKAARCNAAVHDIFDMIRVVIGEKLEELLGRLDGGWGVHRGAKAVADDFEREMRGLLNYANECLDAARARYFPSVPTILMTMEQSTGSSGSRRMSQIRDFVVQKWSRKTFKF